MAKKFKQAVKTALATRFSGYGRYWYIYSQL